MLLVKLIVLSAFIGCWLYSRRSTKATVSDVFILALLAILLPYFLFNPSGQSRIYEQSFSAAVVQRSEIGLLCTFSIGVLVFAAKAVLRTKAHTDRLLVSRETTSQLALVSVALAVASFVCLFAFPEFRAFRWATTRFAMGDLSGPSYRELRGVTFSGGLLLDGLLGRLRYAVLPLLFAIPLIVLFHNRRNLIAVVFSLVFFLALPMSLSKLPIVFYAGYVATAFVASRNGASLKQLLLACVAALLTVVVMISALYVMQYRDSVFSGAVNPILLAIERIWGEPYSVILRYFAVYPDMAPFTGVSGINLLAKIFGATPRLPDIEVARLALGPNSGSNPGIFILGGYAAYGLPGLAAFSLIGFGILWLLDVIAGHLETEFAHCVFMTIMPINCLFLIQVALQTSLLTYGVAIVPVLIFCFDRYLSRGATRSRKKAN